MAKMATRGRSAAASAGAKKSKMVTRNKKAAKSPAAIARLSEVSDTDTVESFLTQKCDQIIGQLKEHSARLVKRLREDYDAKASSLREEARGIIGNKENDAEGNGTSSPSKQKADPIKVVLSCIEGVYAGKTFTVKPVEGGEPCKVGRSTGKKFKSRGISLSKDGEVSTTHGKFEVVEGVVVFTDSGSTNGTFINEGEALNVGERYPLNAGDKIHIGSCIFVRE